MFSYKLEVSSVQKSAYFQLKYAKLSLQTVTSISKIATENLNLSDEVFLILYFANPFLMNFSVPKMHTYRIQRDICI